MIKKLRIRITAVIMIGLTILITGIISGIYIFMQHSETEETEKVMNSARDTIMREDLSRGDLSREDISHDDKETKPQPPNDPVPSSPGSPGLSDPRREPDKSPTSRSWISVLITHDGKSGEVVYSSPFNKPGNEDEICSSAEDISARNSENGYIIMSGVSYRYQISGSGGKTRVIFIDRTNQLATMRRLLVIMIIVGVGTLAVLFPISIIISGWIVRPISKAWNNQKEFFANASHELKTPLTVISANIDVIMS
ncbi:MAG: hypothetical protein II773_00225, partial [Oscillospiraceae bacterium]|nr:hypothetical protein [Oscillospiraceae bacterium]